MVKTRAMSARDAAETHTTIPPDLLASIPPSNGSSPFQSIPVELRLDIYHYVFFTDRCHMKDTALKSGLFIDEFKINASKYIDKNGIPYKLGRAAAILRVNRQVYFEAVPMLYDAVTTLVKPDKAHWQIKSIQPRTHRYRPLDHHQGPTEILKSSCIDDTQPWFAIGMRRMPRMSDLRSISVYDRALDCCDRLDRLAIVIELNFVNRLPEHWRRWNLPGIVGQWEYQGADATLDSDSERWVTRRIRQDSSVRAFVEKIRRVSWVAHLDLDFYIDTFPPKSQRVDDEAEDFEERQEIWRKGDLNIAKIFLETGILDPLQELGNVGSWCIELTVRDQSRMESLVHERMELDLTDAIQKMSPQKCQVGALY